MVEIEAAPLARLGRSWIERVKRLANVAASPRCQAYEAVDFVFGRPARVELVSINHDGEMVLVGGRLDGEVQVSVLLDLAHMGAFKASILDQWNQEVN